MRRRTKAGHDGLGAELRRLRGRRTLGQISTLSKTEPLAGRVKPIAAPTLSLIENGISMPNLETLYTLSVIYKVPMQSLWEIVGLERMVESVGAPSTLAESKAAYLSARASGDQFAALASATAAERHVADDPAVALRWKEARANCLARLGMARDAVHVLHECLEDDALPQADRYRLFRNLAAAHLAAGQPALGVHWARQALEAAPDELRADHRVALEEGLIQALLTRQEAADAPDEREAGEILRVIERVRRRDAGLDERRALLLNAYEALAQRALGNGAWALKVLRQTHERALEVGETATAVSCALNVARIDAAAGRHERALRLLAETESLAEETGEPTLIFEVALASWVSARATERPGSERYRRRCDRYFALVPDRTPAVVRYEKLAGGTES